MGVSPINEVNNAATQRRSRLQHWYCDGVNTPKRSCERRGSCKCPWMFLICL